MRLVWVILVWSLLQYVVDARVNGPMGQDGRAEESERGGTDEAGRWKKTLSCEASCLCAGDRRQATLQLVQEYVGGCRRHGQSEAGGQGVAGEGKEVERKRTRMTLGQMNVHRAAASDRQPPT